MNRKLMLRVIAAIAVFLIIFFSVIPGDIQVRTGAPKTLEHFMAYVTASACLAYVAGTTRRSFIVAFFLIVLAGCLEVIQRWVPGRTATFADWQASGLGSLAGVIAIRLWTYVGSGQRHTPQVSEHAEGALEATCRVAGHEPSEPKRPDRAVSHEMIVDPGTFGHHPAAPS
jgi:VanZ family protein